MSGWQSIFLCRRRRRCYWRRIFTKSSESLTSTGRRRRRRTSSAWCWQRGKWKSHTCAPALCAPRRKRARDAHCPFFACASMTSPRRRNDETSRFQEFLSPFHSSLLPPPNFFCASPTYAARRWLFNNARQSFLVNAMREHFVIHSSFEKYGKKRKKKKIVVRLPLCTHIIIFTANKIFNIGFLFDIESIKNSLSSFWKKVSLKIRARLLSSLGFDKNY